MFQFWNKIIQSRLFQWIKHGAHKTAGRVFGDLCDQVNFNDVCVAILERRVQQAHVEQQTALHGGYVDRVDLREKIRT